MKFIRLTQSGREKGRPRSLVYVDFATVKNFYLNPNDAETILRFIDDTAIGVQEEIETIETLLDE